MDDELNILPISSHMKFIQPVTNNEDAEGLSKRERERVKRPQGSLSRRLPCWSFDWYSNIFVTAPSPENLKTLFDFVCKGINALEYKEHLHYDVVKSADPELKKATIQINVYKQHLQTIQNQCRPLGSEALPRGIVQDM